ncbi:MAG TPA: preprotein translocase subunit YajC [Ideonella sp.]|uniref:preprotein translocase subunit YajC n=1 Tax=Ideonella sp. TaxID=1929293 RepID=UPI002E3549A0|nr:preprotein translocase subunit YajC [Ideonella sp.]HEX5684889.1 preprotein translocase subunit YajC [Ideonella sp.]
MRFSELNPLAIIVPVVIAVVLLAIRMYVLLRVRHKRQREARQEAERLRYLVIAYRSLAGSFTPATNEHRGQLEEALADVVLFGSIRQVELAAACLQLLMRGEPVDYQPLIVELRNDLRTQLGLDPIPETLSLPLSGPGRPPRPPQGEGRAGNARMRPPM